MKVRLFYGALCLGLSGFMTWGVERIIGKTTLDESSILGNVLGVALNLLLLPGFMVAIMVTPGGIHGGNPRPYMWTVGLLVNAVWMYALVQAFRWCLFKLRGQG